MARRSGESERPRQLLEEDQVNKSNPMGLQRVSHPPKSERKRKYDGVLRQAIEEAYSDLNKKQILYYETSDHTTAANPNYILDGPWLMLPEVYKTRMAGRHLKKSYADFRGPNQEAVIWETRRVLNDDSGEGIDPLITDPVEYVYRVFVKAVGVGHDLHPDSAR